MELKEQLIELDNEINRLQNMKENEIIKLREGYKSLKSKIKELEKNVSLISTQKKYKDNFFFNANYRSAITETSAFMEARNNGSYSAIKNTLEEMNYRLNKTDWKEEFTI